MSTLPPIGAVIYVRDSPYGHRVRQHFSKQGKHGVVVDPATRPARPRDVEPGVRGFVSVEEIKPMPETAA